LQRRLFRLFALAPCARNCLRADLNFLAHCAPEHPLSSVATLPLVRTRARVIYYISSTTSTPSNASPFFRI